LGEYWDEKVREEQKKKETAGERLDPHEDLNRGLKRVGAEKGGKS